MIVAEFLAKLLLRKVKDCPVELYNLEVYDTAQWFVRVKSQTNVSLSNIQRDKIIEIIETLKGIVDSMKEDTNEDETS